MVRAVTLESIYHHISSFPREGPSEGLRVGKETRYRPPGRLERGKLLHIRSTSGKDNVVLATKSLSHSPERLIRVLIAVRVPSEPRKRHTTHLSAPVTPLLGEVSTMSVAYMGTILRGNREARSGVSGLPSPLPSPSAYKNRRTTCLSRLTSALGLAEDFLPIPTVASRMTRSLPIDVINIFQKIFQNRSTDRRSSGGPGNPTQFQNS